MTNDCGGCRGQGAHKRWCEAVVGRSAALMGRYAEQADSLGDNVGPNEMGAANHLWIAAGMLRTRAIHLAVAYQEHHGTRRDGKKA